MWTHLARENAIAVDVVVSVIHTLERILTQPKELSILTGQGRGFSIDASGETPGFDPRCPLLGLFPSLPSFFCFMAKKPGLATGGLLCLFSSTKFAVLFAYSPFVYAVKNGCNMH